MIRKTAFLTFFNSFVDQYIKKQTSLAGKTKKHPLHESKILK